MDDVARGKNFILSPVSVWDLLVSLWAVGSAVVCKGTIAANGGRDGVRHSFFGFPSFLTFVQRRKLSAKWFLSKAVKGVSKVAGLWPEHQYTKHPTINEPYFEHWRVLFVARLFFFNKSAMFFVGWRVEGSSCLPTDSHETTAAWLPSFHSKDGRSRGFGFVEFQNFEG